MVKILGQVIDAAVKAGGISLHYRTPMRIGSRTKSSADSLIGAEGAAFLDTEIVTVADPKVEEFLRAVLPTIVNVPVYGEEMGGEVLDDCWVIDPIDGTTNYSLGVRKGGYGFYDTWGQLIALRRGGKVVLGVIYRPDRGDIFYAEEGQGAFVRDRFGNESQLILPKEISGNRVTVGYGLTPDLKALSPEHVNLHNEFRKMIAGKAKSSTVRMLGATGIESMAVACGVQTGYVSTGQYYDVAASEIIIREAGGEVTLLAEKDLKGKMVLVASHKQIHCELVSAVNKHFIEGPNLIVVGATAKSNLRVEER